MSTKSNHARRSHRSEWRKRAYDGSGRGSVITPTARKMDYFGWMKMIRNSLSRGREKSGGGENA